MKQLTLLQTCLPTSVGFNAALSLAERELASGTQVAWYCLDEGVRALDSPELQALKEQGLRLFACAYGARRMGIALQGQAVFSGLALLSELLVKADEWAILDRSTDSDLSPGPGLSAGRSPGDGWGESNKRLLVAVETDPRMSGHAAEAVRVVAGLASWGDLQVSLLLEGTGACLLAMRGEAFVDADLLGRNLELVEKYSVPVMVKEGNEHLPNPRERLLEPTSMDAEGVSDWMSEPHGVIRF